MYEDRFVAFVDILGFKDIVSRSEADVALFESIRGALQQISTQERRIADYLDMVAAKKNAKKLMLMPAADVRMTAFSDCYLISEQASDGEVDLSPWRLVATIQAVGSTLLEKGILTRGAVVRGKAYHDSQMAFGPAIIRAYEIEQSVAKYPRIIVESAVRDAVADETVTWAEELLIEDIDGHSFINVLFPAFSRWSVLNIERGPIDNAAHLNRIRDVLTTKLVEAQTEIRHSTNVRWLVHYFNRLAANHGLLEIAR